MSGPHHDLEDLLLEFDRARRGGAAPQLDQWLPRIENSQRTALLIELVRIDLEYAWQAGVGRTVDEYVRQFPTLDSVAYLELLAAELEARRIAEQLPTESELQRRLAQRSEWLATALNMLASEQAMLYRTSKARSANSLSGEGAKATLIASDSSVAVTKSGDGGQGDQTLEPNTRIGHYVLKEQVGQGAFATVWKARDMQLKRDVAIKILKPDRQRDKTLTQRLLREARAAARLEHPNVVRVHEVVQADNFTYVVSSLVDGPTLDDYIQQRLPDHKEVGRIVREIATGLHAAHESGVVHRDIKPANILMRDSTPLITDFGMAQIERQNEASLTKHGDIVGTPTYMAPEQARGENHLIDARTDVYALGAVLYRMIVGKVPFEGSVASVIHDVINSAPTSPCRIDSRIPRDLETIILKCLEKDPIDRYPSAAAVAEDLKRFGGGQPITARPASLTEQTWKWARRRPKIAALMAALVLLTGFLLGALVQLQAVRYQRDRAGNAEHRSRQLLAASSADAGRLAVQRGQMRRAVTSFQTSLSMGFEHPDALRLDLIEALIAIREIDRANQQMTMIDAKTLSSELRSKKILSQAELAMESHATVGDPIQLLEQARDGDLPPGDAAYVDAMLSERTPDVIDHLERSVELQPLSHRNRRALITMLISLARLDEAETQIRIAMQMFPGDVDFALMNCMVLASRKKYQMAEQQLQQADLLPEERAQWQKGLSVIRFATTELSHRMDAELGFNKLGISQLIDRFNSDLSPCLAAREFRFPPRIATRFAEFGSVVDSFIEAGAQDEAVQQSLDELATIHPEASLLVLLMGQYVEINDLPRALALAQQAVELDGFVDDTHEMSVEGCAVIAAVMFIRKVGDRRTNAQIFVDAVERFEALPELVDRYRTARKTDIFTTVAVESLFLGIGSAELATRWLERYAEADGANRHLYHWIHMLIAQNRRDWISVVEHCNKQLELDPHDEYSHPNVEIQGAKEEALLKIAELTGNGDASSDK